MSKVKQRWECNECHQQQAKWSGQCPQCNAWDTMREVELSSSSRLLKSKSQPVALSEVRLDHAPRMTTQIGEFDRLLGGGVVPGSFLLIAGDPGIGKSTLLLQVADGLVRAKQRVLYVCGEESLEQTKQRAERLRVSHSELFLLHETNVEHLFSSAQQLQPQIMVIDSIQVLYREELPSAPGSVGQVRECAAQLMTFAKRHHIAIFVVGHITKGGEIAGPKLLEHLVDTVLYFEGEKLHHYRILRVMKNRFGTTDEMGLFAMSQVGLKEITNPSQLFLDQQAKHLPGSIVFPSLEGSRPILVEIQSLVTKTAFSAPTRKCSGFDANRLPLLLAVMEKRLGFPLYQCDIFISFVGGMKVIEPAVDLGVLLSITSSWSNYAFPPDLIVLGEVGLGGEIRGVSRSEARLKEAYRMGFKQAVLPRHNEKSISAEWREKMALFYVDCVDDAIRRFIRPKQKVG